MMTTMEQVREANARKGGHWFSPDTRRFFGSRVGGTLYGGRYFVSSEWTGWDHDGRAYTIREALEDGEIGTVGEFLAWGTRDAAIREIRRLLKGSA